MKNETAIIVVALGLIAVCWGIICLLIQWPLWMIFLPLIGICGVLVIGALLLGIFLLYYFFVDDTLLDDEGWEIIP